jgi:hypothetical protein
MPAREYAAVMWGWRITFTPAAIAISLSPLHRL